VTWSSGEPAKIFYSWNLQVTVDVPGVDLDRNYIIRMLPLQPGAVPAAAPVSETRKEIKQEIRKEPKVESLSPIQAATLAVAAPQVQARAPVVQEQTKNESRDRSPLWVLVAANLVPIAGALFWGWAVADVVLLYWIENLVIGFFNLLRIMFAQPDQSEAAARGLEITGGALLAGKAAFASFFLVHYGAFCLAHGGVLLDLFVSGQRGGEFIETVDAVMNRGKGIVFALLHYKEMALAVLAIVASHGYSFFRNYLGRREYDGVDFKELMFRPYKRIFVTHIFVLAGGFALQAMKLPAAALVVFIAIKIFADVYYHRAERDAFGAVPAAA